MRNARAWVQQRHPGAGTLEASKKILRFPDKKKPGEWVNHTAREDIWGVFDILAFPIDGLVECIQVTSIVDGSLGPVKARLSKVGTWIRDTFPNGGAPAWVDEIYVIGWVSRKHFQIWRWSWDRAGAHHWGRWDELEPEPVRKPKAARSVPVVSVSALGECSGNPFD